MTYVTMDLYFYKNCRLYDFSMCFMSETVEHTNAIGIKIRRKVMKQIQDDTLLQFYMEKYGIAELFETEGLTFRLYEYERGGDFEFYPGFLAVSAIFCEGKRGYLFGADGREPVSAL